MLRSNTSEEFVMLDLCCHACHAEEQLNLYTSIGMRLPVSPEACWATQNACPTSPFLADRRADQKGDQAEGGLPAGNCQLQRSCLLFVWLQAGFPFLAMLYLGLNADAIQHYYHLPEILSVDVLCSGISGL